MKPIVRRIVGLAAGTMMAVAAVGFTASQATAQETESTSIAREATSSTDIGIQSNCNHAWSIIDGSLGGTTGNGVNIRTGPHNTSPVCAIVGQAQSSHSLMYDCWVSGTGGTWSHIYDFATGKQGWVKDSLLLRNGAAASAHC